MSDLFPRNVITFLLRMFQVTHEKNRQFFTARLSLRLNESLYSFTAAAAAAKVQEDSLQ